MSKLLEFGKMAAGENVRVIGSDRRIKTDIVPVAIHPTGLTVYRYTYLTGDEPEYGLMAQDVQAVRPHAVAEVMGILCVDYAAALA